MIEGSGNCLHAFEIAEHVRPDEKIKVIRRPGHGQLREERSLASLLKPHAFEIKAEAAIDRERHGMFA